MSEIKDYEEACRRIRIENEKYLEIFKKELVEKALSEKTIRSHISNVDFYINDFLLYRDPVPMKQGCGNISEFLGDFFIRKCMWSTPAAIRSNVTSLKKFYKCMLEYESVRKEDYGELCEIIKDNIDDWLEDCRQFNDPEQVNPFFPF